MQNKDRFYPFLNVPELVCLYAEAPGQKVPLPNVPGKILSKVIEYCKFHVDNSRDANKPSSSQGVKSDEEVKTWDADFMKIDQSTLFEVILVSFLLSDKPQQTYPYKGLL